MIFKDPGDHKILWPFLKVKDFSSVTMVLTISGFFFFFIIIISFSFFYFFILLVEIQRNA